MTDLARRLKEDIRKSGLPTEIQVTNMLKQDNWVLINQYPYVDQREQKIRTLDILAGKLFKNGKACILYVECKKGGDHQWVFYTSRGFEEGLSLLLRAAEDVVRRVRAPGNGVVKEKPLYSFHPGYLPSQSIGLISHIPFGKGDSFNVARNQLLSAIESKRLPASEQLVIYPVIVFDGDIYEVQPNADDIALNETDYIIFLSSMISEITPILIDVVTLNSFPSYLNQLNQELGPSYSYAEIVELISGGLKVLQDFAQALVNAGRELEKISGTSHSIDRAGCCN